MFCEFHVTIENKYKHMKLLIVGATGLVGRTMIEVLEQRQFPVSEFMPVASKLNKRVSFSGDEYEVKSLDEGLRFSPDIALFSAGDDLSLVAAPGFADRGSRVIDNSSAWRMDPDKKLIVPEINGNLLEKTDMIIANPNCSTIQFVMVAAPLHRKFTIRRSVISTYQSVSGSGIKAIRQLESERKGASENRFYPHPIDKNCLPHIDAFLDNGYTREEMKMVQESQKILNDPNLKITATAVRVPVQGGHSESVNIEFEKPFEIEEVISILNNTPGVTVQDDIRNNVYPMPIIAEGKDEVFVGRIRKDTSLPNALNLWIVSDNLRKGAATNAVQIAEVLIKKNFV